MINQITHKLREQIHHFSGKLSYGLCKPARRFVEETIRFIKQSYQEENVRVITYERLRNMASGAGSLLFRGGLSRATSQA